MHNLDKPLSGKRILVTRPKHQNQNLSHLIEQSGGQAILFPVIEIRPYDNFATINSQFSNFNHWDWIIFTSANSVKFAFEINNDLSAINKTTKVAAIGSSTANHLHKRGISVDLVPKVSNSEGLCSALQMQQIKDKRCLIIKGLGGRSVLGQSLTQIGAKVTHLDVYRRQCPNSNPQFLLDQWKSNMIDFVTVTSVETLKNLLNLIGDENIPLLKKSIIVTLSRRVQNAAIKNGLSNVVTATETSDDGIVESIVQIQKNGLKSTPRVQSN